MVSSTRMTPPIYPLDFDPHPKTHGSSPSPSSMDDLFRNISTSVAVDSDGGDLFRKPDDGALSGGFDGGITLEEYLSKDEISIPAGFAVAPPPEDPVLGFGNGGGGMGRGRKRPALDLVDRATLRRQKRMIKNRESAARSRERKQAYTVELESLVTQLEEENARLVTEQEFHRQRHKQLMENLIPVTEKKRPPRALRRTHSI